MILSKKSSYDAISQELKMFPDFRNKNFKQSQVSLNEFFMRFYF